MKSVSEQDFERRTKELFAELSQLCKHENIFLEWTNISFNLTVPSFKATAIFNVSVIQLKYSENHLDYDQGITVSATGKDFVRFDKLGVNLKLRKDAKILKMFSDVIVQLCS